MDERAVVLVAHGSRDMAAMREFQEQAARLGERLPGVVVRAAAMEFGGETLPDLLSIPDTIDALVAAGTRAVAVLPLFFFSAGHVRVDVPLELDRARARHPWLPIRYLPPLSVCEELLDVVEARAAEADAALGEPEAGPTALLLVGAGTSDAQANAELAQAARLLWERRRFPLVEIAFVSLTEPRVVDGVGRCAALGARRVLLIPYFLNTGVLARRIARQLSVARQRYPELRCQVGEHMGTHPRLIDLLEGRARAGLELLAPAPLLEAARR